MSKSAQIARRSFSLWTIYIAIAVFVVTEAIFWLTGIDTNPYTKGLIYLLLLGLGILGRFVPQGISMHGTGRWGRRIFLIGMALVLALTGSLAFAAPPSERAFSAVAVPLVAKWEGKRNTAYQDVVGVWTICYGHTRTVVPGETRSDAECEALLRAELLEYRVGLHGYFTPETLAKRLTAKRDAAYTSLAFNVGIRGAGRSTATRRLNAGNIRGGCTALTWWNKAGGRVWRGLVRRRADEERLCLAGL